MHSYWDDFFALRGFKDAAFIAKELDKPEAANFAQIRNSFRSNLFESIRQVVITRRIDYIPGSVELADFDATSTTIAVSPVGEAGRLPGPLLLRTFEKYFQEARARAVGAKPWDSYTPYELRTSALTWIGSTRRAHECWISSSRISVRRRGTVGRGCLPGSKTPKFIGDMRHVGRARLHQELLDSWPSSESDSSLLIGAGVRDDWVKRIPVRVANLSTSTVRSTTTCAPAAMW